MLKTRLNSLWSAAAILLLLVWTEMGGAQAQNIIVHLKNGDRISGRLVSESTNSLRITTPLFGEVDLPVSEISKRETLPEPAPPVTVAPPGVTTNVPPALVQTNKAAQSAPTTVPAKAKEKPPLAPANPEASPIAETPRYWKHDLRFGVNLRYAAKDSQEMLAIAKSTYGKPPFRQIFDVNFKYGRTEGLLSSHSLATSSKSEYQLSSSDYIFGLVGGGYDEIRRIDIQYEVGPGYGRELLKLTNFVWKTEIGFNFQQQYRADDTTKTHYSARLAQIFAWRVWDKLTADAKLEFLPNIGDFGEYRFRLESTLRYPVTPRLSLNLDVIDLYDSEPVRGIPPNDLQIRSTIGVTF